MKTGGARSPESRRARGALRSPRWTVPVQQAEDLPAYVASTACAEDNARGAEQPIGLQACAAWGAGLAGTAGRARVGSATRSTPPRHPSPAPRRCSSSTDPPARVTQAREGKDMRQHHGDRQAGLRRHRRCATEADQSTTVTATSPGQQCDDPTARSAGDHPDRPRASSGAQGARRPCHDHEERGRPYPQHSSTKDGGRRVRRNRPGPGAAPHPSTSTGPVSAAMATRVSLRRALTCGGPHCTGRDHRPDEGGGEEDAVDPGVRIATVRPESMSVAPVDRRVIEGEQASMTASPTARVSTLAMSGGRPLPDVATSSGSRTATPAPARGRR